MYFPWKGRIVRQPAKTGLLWLILIVTFVILWKAVDPSTGKSSEKSFGELHQLIEQNAMMALSIAKHGYILETGKVVMDGEAQKLLGDEDVQEFYLGLHGEGGERKSFRDVKHYKRRKRWLS